MEKSIQDIANEAFKHLEESGLLQQAAIDAALAALEQSDPAAVAAFLQGMGLATDDKKGGAVVLAVIRQGFALARTAGLLS